MPGTIQVSILELTGLPSSKSSSSMSIKVSLGKHTYEAEGEKGDFLFPLATLRDNLVVKVHDNEGIEIANTGVKSRLIAEKGSWDDLFPLEGGGHVHMRLKFSLSEEERNRIRNMRESALRKKQEELLKKNNKSLQIVVASSGGGNEMPSTAAISDKVQSIDLPLEASSKVVSSKSRSTPINSSASSKLKGDDQGYNLKEQIPLEETPSTLKEDDQPYNLKEQIQLEEAPRKLKEDDQPYKLKEESPLEKTLSRLQEDDQPYNLKEQSPVQETPSKLQEDDQPYNLKDQTPLEKTSSELQEDDQPYIPKEQNPLEKTFSKLQEDDQPYNLKEQSPLEKTPSILQEDDQAYILKEQSPLEKTPSKAKDNDRRYSLKEQTPLERTPSKVRETIAAFESSRLTQGQMNTAKAQSSRELPTLYETKYVDNVEYKSREVLLDEKEPKEKYPLHNIVETEERICRCSCYNIHGWIFLEEAICTCIVGDNRMVIDLHGDYNVDPKTYPRKVVGEEASSSKEDKIPGIAKIPDSEHSSGDGASRGPHGQVMKIVIMVGFGLLVLFTRNRKSR